MSNTIIIFGGGISGLTAAHELAERGFKVKVFEKNGILGGKARSFGIKGNLNKDQVYPGEHGFRFFIKWYENIHDTFKKIPVKNTDKTVYENLVPVKELLVDEHLFYFDKASVAPIKPPLAWLKAMTSCDNRLEEDFEQQSWDEYMDANLKGETEKVLRFFKNTPKVTASVHSTEASVRALCYTLNRFLTNNGLDILNGPTNFALFDHWQVYLESLGVEFVFDAQVIELAIENGAVVHATVSVAGIEIQVAADFYLSAIPHLDLQNILTPVQQKQNAFQFLDSLKSGWQAGILLYLKNSVAMPRGHFGLSESPWAISGIMQTDFWSQEQYKEHVANNKFGACLSLIIADWEAPGLIYNKSAKECTLIELVDELLYQMEFYAPEAFKESYSSFRNLMVDYSIDPGIHLTGDNTASNETPLYMNIVDSWEHRPHAATELDNFFIAGDFARTSAYLATMESANESGRRAANAILEKSGSKHEKCKIYTAKHNAKPKIFEPLIKIDELLYSFDKSHLFDYLSDSQVDEFVESLMPFVSFDGQNLKNVDKVYESTGILLKALTSKLPQLSAEILELLLPYEYDKDQALKEELCDRSLSWSKVNYVGKQNKSLKFPESLTAYIDLENPIYKPMYHVAKSQGSMNRAQFAMALNNWFEVPMDKIMILMETGQNMHNSSLLIDDIMDNTSVRRQEKTAHEIFGVNQTLGAAYSTYFQVMLSTYVNLGSKCLVHYLEETARAHIGQSEDVYYREEKICPSVEKYIEIIANKTGSFFRVFSLCLSSLSENKYPKEIQTLIFKFADTLGKLYQVRDDYMDLMSEEYFKKKGTFASDFEEGKYSLPIIYAVQHSPETAQYFKELLGKQSITENEKQFLLKKLIEAGGIAKTLEMVNELYADTLSLFAEIQDQTNVTNAKMLEWIQGLMKDIPEMALQQNDLVLKSTNGVHKKPKDPFDIKKIDRDTMYRALRNIFCSYHTYFKLNGWNEEQFWISFPLLVTVESMIINVDNENENADSSESILDWNVIKNSKSWMMISRSSFYAPQMDELLNDAIKYYKLEKKWFFDRSSIQNEETLVQMNHLKSTNFRIMHLLAKNICAPNSKDINTENMEDYVSLKIEDFETLYDSVTNEYNPKLHSYQIQADDQLFDKLKNSLYNSLDDTQKEVAEIWFDFYKQSFRYKESDKSQSISTSLKKIYNFAQDISILCRSDEAISEFTLKGNFKWCISRMFSNLETERGKDVILSRLQSDALLSFS